MNEIEYKQQWMQEAAHGFAGWDFSHLKGRWDGEDLPWSYRDIVTEHLAPHHKILDMGTGGGEFLLSLHHPHEQTAVTEGYPPNVALCRQTLEPLGIQVAQTFDDGAIPYPTAVFDMVLNRHESFDPRAVDRVLKPGGYFITQQVGETNCRDLSERVMGVPTPPHEANTLKNHCNALNILGYKIELAKEHFCPLKFFDIGALVYYATIIEWEFPGFSVEQCFDRLWQCHLELERNGFISGTEHRFLIVAKKP